MVGRLLAPTDNKFSKAWLQTDSGFTLNRDSLQCLYSSRCRNTTHRTEKRWQNTRNRSSSVKKSCKVVEVAYKIQKPLFCFIFWYVNFELWISSVSKDYCCWYLPTLLDTTAANWPPNTHDTAFWVALGQFYAKSLLHYHQTSLNSFQVSIPRSRCDLLAASTVVNSGVGSISCFYLKKSP